MNRFYPTADALALAVRDLARNLAALTDSETAALTLQRVQRQNESLPTSPPRFTAAALLAEFVPEECSSAASPATATALVRRLLGEVRELCQPLLPSRLDLDHEAWHRVSAGLEETGWMDPQNTSEYTYALAADLAAEFIDPAEWEPYENEELFATVAATVYQARQGFWKDAEGDWSGTPIVAN